MTTFKSGDRVVYPHHGAAVIQRTETREHNGEKTKYFVLQAVHDNLTVRVPVEMADEVGMRLPISREDVEDLFVLLSKRDVREPAIARRESTPVLESQRRAFDSRSSLLSTKNARLQNRIDLYLALGGDFDHRPE